MSMIKKFQKVSMIRKFQIQTLPTNPWHFQLGHCGQNCASLRGTCLIFAMVWCPFLAALCLKVALLILSSWCLVMVGRLFLAVPQGCLRYVIVVFPDHTHLLFLWSDVGKWLTSVTFSCGFFLSLSHSVSWVRCWTWFYQYLSFAFFTILIMQTVEHNKNLFVCNNNGKSLFIDM